MNRFCLILVMVLAVAGGAGRPAPAWSSAVQAQNYDNNRVPTNDDKHRFPRWLPQVMVDVTFTGTVMAPNCKPLAMGVDRRNIVHMVGMEDSGAGKIVHYNNSPGRRRSNGFSTFLPVYQDNATAHITGIMVPDMAVGPDPSGTKDVVHVVFRASAQAGGSSNDLYYMRYADGVWSTDPVNLTNSPSTTPIISFAPPRIAVDASGNAHVVVRRDSNSVRNLWEYIVSPAGVLISGGFISNTTNGTDPQLFKGTSLHLGWYFPSGGTMQLKHQVYSTTWGASNVLYTGNASVALAASKPPGGSADDVHCSWAEGNFIKYNLVTGGLTPGTVETVSTVNQTVSVPLIAADAQSQPHIVWSGGGKFCYASRTKNAGLTGPDYWVGRQEPSQDFIDFGVGEGCVAITAFAVNKNGGLYVSGQSDRYNNPAFFTRSIEYNLGEQDGAAMAPVGMRARANVVNGNLFMGFPIFSSDGAGLSTNLALYWNSQSWEPSPISQGWSHSYQVYLVDSRSGINDLTKVYSTDQPPTPVAADVITLFMGDGRAIPFRWKDTDPQSQNAKFHVAYDEFGYFGRIQRENPVLDTYYVLTTKQGVVYRFDNAGRLIQITNLDGTTLSISYPGSSGTISGITDTKGRQTNFIYDSEWNLASIVTVEDDVSHELAYTATGAKPLQTLTINKNSPTAEEKPVWSFQYHATDDQTNNLKANLISQVTTPFPADFKYYYFQDNRLKKSQDPTLTTSSINDSGVAVSPHPPTLLTYTDPVSFPPPAGQPLTVVKDRRTNDWKYEYESRKGLVTKLTDGATKVTTRVFNNSYRNLTSVTDPDNNVTTITYTSDAGNQQTPVYVKDNVKSIVRPDANTTSGNAAATVPVATLGYDPSLALVTSVQKPNPAAAGNVTWGYPRDAGGNVSSIVYPSNPSPEGFVWSQGQLQMSTRPRGGVTQYTPSVATGLPGTIQLPDHTQGTAVTYDVMGYVTQATTPMGGATTYARDGLHRVTTETSPAGTGGSLVLTYQYDLASGQVKQIDYSNGGQTKHTYDELGRVLQTDVKKTAAITLSTIYRYDPEGNLKKVTDPNGNILQYTHTARNQVDTKTLTSAGSDPTITTQYFYTNAGFLDHETTGADTTTYLNTAWGMVKKVTYPLGIVDDVLFTADGRVRTVERSQSGVFKAGTMYSYDPNGRLIGVAQMVNSGTTGAHLNSSLGLDADGNVQTVTDPSGRVFSYTYDLAGRLIDAKNASGTVVSHRDYDDNDRVTTLKVLNPKTGSGLVTAATNSYNVRDELLSSVDALSHSNSYTYTVTGAIDTINDGKNITTKHAYNLLSQLISVTKDYGGAGLVTQYDYDANGNLNKVIDPGNKQTTYTYSSTNKLKSINYPGGAVDQWTFDSKGRKATWASRRGFSVTYTYDAFDRETGASYNGGALANILTSYDGASNVTEVLNTVTKISHGFGYDTARRPTSTSITLNRTALGTGGTLWKSSSCTYNPDSTVNTYTNPENHVYQYGYELQGSGGLQLITRTSPAPSKTYATYFRDGAGRIKETLLQNGADTYFDRDVAGNLTKLRSVNTTGKGLTSFAFTYNTRNDRTNILLGHLGTSVNYDYFNHGALMFEDWSANTGGVDVFNNTLTSGIPGNESAQTAAVSVAPAVPPAITAYRGDYTYDPSGNRSTRITNLGGTITNYSYAYDAENRLTGETITGATSGSVTYGYGSVGNPNILTRTAGSLVETYGYDYADRMVSFVKQSGATTLANYAYSYLPTGQRLAKINAATSTNNEEWYFPDGTDTTADYQRSTSAGVGGASTLLSTYVNGGSIDSKLARITAAGAEYYYLSDGLGSVSRVIDSAQAIQNTVLTTAWGEQHPGFAPIIGQPDRYGFTQREIDSESGLLHFRARAYDPRIGRFTQTDPILGNRATKHYAYAGNNPVSMIDPMGLDEAEWEAVKPYLLDVNWVKTHKKQPKLVDPNKNAIYSSGGQGVLQRAYESYQLALQTGDAVSAYYRLRDLEVGYMEGPDVLDSIYNSKEKLMQYLLIVQGSAAGINLQGLGSAQAINKMMQEMQPSGRERTRSARAIAKGQKPSEPELLPMKGVADVEGERVPFTVSESGGIRKVLNPGGTSLRTATMRGTVDFVVTADDQIMIGSKHSFMAGGKSVKAAGELIFNSEGKLVGISNASGHYTPSASNMDVALKALQERKIDVSQVSKQPWTP